MCCWYTRSPTADHILLCSRSFPCRCSTDSWNQHCSLSFALQAAASKQYHPTPSRPGFYGDTRWVQGDFYKWSVPSSWSRVSSTPPAVCFPRCNQGFGRQWPLVCRWYLQDMSWSILLKCTPSMVRSMVEFSLLFIPCRTTKSKPTTNPCLKKSTDLLVVKHQRLFSWNLSLLL